MPVVERQKRHRKAKGEEEKRHTVNAAIPPERPLIEITYVDDVGFFVSWRTPWQMFQSCPIVLRAISEMFAAFGLEINLSPGKDGGIPKISRKEASPLQAVDL